MSENHNEPSGEAAGDVTPRGEPTESRKRFEDEKMTRREALRKIGLTMGMATFAMLSVDDLARFSAKKLQENEVSKGIGDVLATEFRSAGVAFASGNPSGPFPSGPTPTCPENCNNVCSDCVADVNTAWANTSCGWWNSDCADKVDEINDCFAARDTCVAACPPPPPPPNPSGPATCQERCEDKLIGDLIQRAQDGSGDLANCLANCSAGRSTNDFMSCAQTCVGPLSLENAEIKQFLECCYGACDLGQEGAGLC